MSMLPQYGDYNMEMLKSGGFYPSNLPNIMNTGKPFGAGGPDSSGNGANSTSKSGFNPMDYQRGPNTTDSGARKYYGPVAHHQQMNNYP